jgi:cardiolipin synthase
MARKKQLKFYTLHNKVKLLRGGADYFDCIEQMADNARYSIHLQTYIYDPDETGTRVAEALIRAANRGVLVYVLIDGFASKHMSHEFIGRLRAAGIHFSFFKTFIRSSGYYFGRRLHHKVVVADGNTCLVAGVNISNRYNDINGTPAWLDWAVYAEGEVALQLDRICISVWDRSVFRKKCTATANPLSLKLPEETCPVRVSRNDWVFKQTQITKTYRQLLDEAKSHVTIMTGYFVPPRRLLKKMAVASRRGVKIRLILAGVADVPFSKYAERYLYAWLFRHKIEVYEYQKNILHGKMAVCDNEWITVGSYNFNNLSAFASIELNLDIIDTNVANDVNAKFEAIIANDCVPILEEGFTASTNLLTKFFFYLSYRIVHLTFVLFTFYFFQQNEKSENK